jgi:HK97 family phage portal protein
MSKSLERRGFLARMILAAGFRPRMASPENPATNPAAWMMDWMGGGNADSGIAVNKMSALQATVVYRCVSLIAGTIASLPLMVMRQIPGGQEAASTHYLWPILHDEPNPMLSSFTWRETTLAHLLMSGNAYSAIEWTNAGRVAGLYPIQPEYVTVSRVGGRLQYGVRLQGGGEQVIDQEDMLHVPGLGYDGIQGISVIQAVLKNPVGLAVSLDKTVGRTSQNALRPSAVISAPKMQPDAVARFRAAFKAQNAGADNAGEPLFMEPGWELKPWSISPADAEILNSRKYQNEDIARAFGVPPHMIGSTEKGSSWGTGMEQMTIGYVNFTLVPWIARVLNEINRKLLADSGYQAYFLLDNLLRGDSAARGAFLAQMIQNGIYTPNEARRMEGLPPTEYGDQAFIAVNLQSMKNALAAPAAAANPAGGRPPAPAPAAPPPGEDGEVAAEPAAPEAA